ncbi:sugar phosphate isomerase/epimerase family protein [Alteromonas lipolytica]|uniref:Xylose isomerase-like TIM barrel domain-containing protein n=1 Tax=Alteromonas lipolytica TaxID=1856405 RepID=A0A1E8FHP3_9ALTE|nr:sugar phosphate isomerase/epimerase [Alteromonas lipolytica]OFI35128.1 hypothetical protein BFC17_16410 [Alteromonas lipolytica]GGF56922.1 xylose isomerase [Alteromonas lipolytica]
MAINRRQFLTSASAFALLAGTPVLWSCASRKPAACSGAGQYGVQLYMFRESFAKAPQETLAQIAAMGFNSVEPFGLGGFPGIPEAPFFGLSLEQMAAALKAVNLKTPTAHVSGELNDPHYTDALAGKLNIDYFIEPLARELLSVTDTGVTISIPQSQDEIMRMAERINLRGKKFHDAGHGFAYHNHHMEFATVEGNTILDLIMENTDPDYVKLELDLGWVAVADADPLAVLKQYGKRVIGCHMKDRDYSIKVNSQDTDELMPEALQVKAPGQGDLDFASIVAYLDKQNIQNRYVEVDVTAAPFEDAKFGLAHLQQICS